MTKTLAHKLGWKPGSAGRVFGMPDGLDLGLPDEAGGAADILLFFVRDGEAIAHAAAEAEARYRDGARLWFAYPKKSGSLRTDIDRDHGWGPMAERDFLPVSQFAVDADWSALRFRRRRGIARLTRKWDQA